MVDFKAVLRKIIILITAVIAGICIFATIASAMLDNSLFNQIPHKKLFEKYGIYSYIGNTAKNYFSEYSKNLGKDSPDNIKQQQELVSLIDKALTQEMISMNINSIMDGLVSYFKSETRFLPDLYLKPASEVGTVKNEAGTSNPTAANSLAGIDRINSSIILMYMNRTDISDKLMVVRLFQFALSKLPLISCILVVICLLCGYLAVGRKKHLFAWYKITLLTAGVIFFVCAIALLAFIYLFLPRSIEIKSLFAVLPESVTSGYIKDWLSPYILLLSVSGAIAFSLIPLLKYITFKVENSKIISYISRRFSVIENIKKNPAITKYARIIVSSVFLLVLIIFSIVQLQIARNEFHSKDLTVALDRMKGITAFSRVVYAKDAAVYALEIRIVDKKTELPVQGIQMHITGKSANKGTAFDLLKTSDTEGKAKVMLDEGSFNISFSYDKFPEEYIMPSPYYFKIESAGTTVLTISLDKMVPKNPGIIEIQILDKENKPVNGLELELESVDTIENQAMKTFSFTNTEGIAAFRTAEGKYKVTVLSAGFPAEYEILQPIDTEVVSDVTSRYSIRLVQKGNSSTPIK
jgi:hypothetical protein